MIKLYGYWRSTAAYRVRIALNLKQIAYESISVHLVKNGGEQHSPDFAKLNPQHLVPVLVDGDFRLTQSMAILEYLEAIEPSFKLIPREPKDAAKVRAMANLIANDVHPLNNLRVLQYLTGNLGVSESEKNRWYSHWVLKGFSAFESLLDQLASTEFCFGNSLSMADVVLIPQVYNANRFGVDLSAFPRIRSINEHCLSLPEFIQASPDNQPDAQ